MRCKPSLGYSLPVILGYNWFLNNPRGWLMSEKLDGVRAFWDGATLWTRDYKRLNAPDWFLANLPKGVGLDGELWHGRGNYRETMKIFQAKDAAPIWQTVKFGIFDAPKHDGQIEERTEYLKTLPLCGPLFVLRHEACRSMVHLKKSFREVYDNGGEGLVLRKAGSDYLHERTTQFLKVKCPW